MRDDDGPAIALLGAIVRRGMKDAFQEDNAEAYTWLAEDCLPMLQRFDLYASRRAVGDWLLWPIDLSSFKQSSKWQ